MPRDFGNRRVARGDERAITPHAGTRKIDRCARDASGNVLHQLIDRVDSVEDLERLRHELATLPPSVAPATRRVLGSAP